MAATSLVLENSIRMRKAHMSLRCFCDNCVLTIVCFIVCSCGVSFNKRAPTASHIKAGSGPREVQMVQIYQYQRRSRPREVETPQIFLHNITSQRNFMDHTPSQLYIQFGAVFACFVAFLINLRCQLEHVE